MQLELARRLCHNVCWCSGQLSGLHSALNCNGRSPSHWPMYINVHRIGVKYRELRVSTSWTIGHYPGATNTYTDSFLVKFACNLILSLPTIPHHLPSTLTHIIPLFWLILLVLVLKERCVLLVSAKKCYPVNEPSNRATTRWLLVQVLGVVGESNWTWTRKSAINYGSVAGESAPRFPTHFYL